MYLEALEATSTVMRAAGRESRGGKLYFDLLVSWRIRLSANDRQLLSAAPVLTARNPEIFRRVSALGIANGGEQRPPSCVSDRVTREQLGTFNEYGRVYLFPTNLYREVCVRSSTYRRRFRQPFGVD